MKTPLIAILMLMLISFCMADAVSIELATEIGINFLAQLGNSDFSFSGIEPIQNKNIPELSDLYILRFQPEGFVIVAGDDRSTPILGYSFDSMFPEGEVPSHVALFLDQYAASIDEIRQDPRLEIDSTWSMLRSGDFSMYQPSRNVAPLLTTTWNQNYPYNYHCPAAEFGPGGHVYAGNVATTMAQIMKKWNHPVSGQGSHSYLAPGYGTLSANFGTTTYNWPAMPNSISNVTSPVSILIYHCGVSVDMQYGPNGSGATSDAARNALVNYFRYHSDAEYLYAADYQATTWAGMLRADLNLGRPIFYRGQGSEGATSFVLDGYQGPNSFHINWGWGGNYDGYYYLNNLNPNNHSFTQFQGAILNIYPQSFATLSGTVTCQGVSMPGATVSIEGTEFSATTNNFGFYSISGIPSTTYQITASHPDCLPTTTSLYIVSSTTPTLNFTLEPEPDLQPPQDLFVSVDYDDVTLSWNTPLPSTNSTLIGYRIYRSGQLIEYIHHPACTLYTDVRVPNGEYQYQLTALYIEGESDPISANATVMTNGAPLIFSDNFESYPDFALAFPPWTLVDQDLADTQSLPGISYPSSTIPKAFMIFNPTTTIPAYTVLSPHSGTKMAACFASSVPPNSDWLISPRLQLGTASSVRFFAKSNSAANGLERIKVGISTLQNPITQGFNYISGTTYLEVPTTWTEYTFDLSAYDNMMVYIAIRCVSEESEALFVDDFCVYSNLEDTTDPFGTPVFLPSSMLLNASVSIDGMQATNGDVLAAYVSMNGILQLRGKQRVQLAGGVAWCAMPIYTISNAETVLFRIWDASSEQVIQASAPLSTTVGAEIGSFPDDLYQINGLFPTEPVENPEFTPSGGLYYDPQTVFISSPNPNATIRYTSDGTEPSPSSAIYTYPFFLPSNSTRIYKAKAFVAGTTPSATITATYQITGMVEAPVFSPEDGYYTSAIDVTISCATPNAEIRYTIDDSQPSESSPLYTAPIHLVSNTSLRAKAFLAGWTPSNTTSGVYLVYVDNDDEVNAPIVTGINSAYPNPFRNSITFALGVDRQGKNFKLLIYNVKGERVFQTQGYAKGCFDYTWDGKEKNGKTVAKGIYIVSFQSEGIRSSRKVIRF